MKLLLFILGVVFLMWLTACTISSSPSVPVVQAPEVTKLPQATAGVLVVEGLTCQSCRKTIGELVEPFSHAELIYVDLTDGTADIKVSEDTDLRSLSDNLAAKGFTTRTFKPQK